MNTRCKYRLYPLTPEEAQESRILELKNMRERHQTEEAELLSQPLPTSITRLVDVYPGDEDYETAEAQWVFLKTP